MGHEVVQRGRLGARTLSLLLNPVPGWPFSSFFSPSLCPPFFLFPCCSGSCSPRLSVEHCDELALGKICTGGLLI